MQMKKFKLAFWIVILGFIGLIVYQNRELLFESESLGINLMFAEYQTPKLPMALFFAVVFLLGLLIGYVPGLFERFKSGKTIKKQQETIRAQQGALDEMKKDIAALKPQAEPAAAAEPQAPAAEGPEPPADPQAVQR
jgi:hypothetical protein